MKENIYYVYVYLNPLKSGKFEYLENGIGITFDYEPFYVGEGKDYRIKDHLKQARRLLNDSIHSYTGKHAMNWHKINTIKKIWSEGLEPIIYKICQNMPEQSALNLEETLGFLIGRLDKKRGPLTNLVDCGGESKNLSDEIKINKKKKEMETKNNDPSIMKNAITKGLQTKKDDPSCLENQVKNLKITLANDPSIIENQVKHRKETYKNDPNLQLNANKKSSKTRIENKIAVGKHNSNYKIVDYKFIIIQYFETQSI